MMGWEDLAALLVFLASGFKVAALPLYFTPRTPFPKLLSYTFAYLDILTSISGICLAVSAFLAGRLGVSSGQWLVIFFTLMAIAEGIKFFYTTTDRWKRYRGD